MDGLPDDALMERVEELYTQAKFVTAWSLLDGLAPPETWRHPKWQARAARIMNRVGAPRRARKLVFRLWHARDSRETARELMFWEVLGMRGTLRAWQWLQAHPPGPDASEEDRTDHFVYRAYALSDLRDFERAKIELDEGLRRNPDKAWFHTIKAHLLAKQDRHLEALAAAEDAMRLDDRLMSAVGAASESLLALGRDAATLTLLRDALGRIEGNPLAANLVNLEIELELHADAARSLDRYESLLPLMEDDFRNWIRARRCDLACHAGDYDAARALAEQITESGFYRSIARRLEGARTGLQRRLLPVQFVRQHHLTCVPASLAMISRYWSRPVEHVALAEEICHDGTPHHLERKWADEHGFATREFTVTVESAKQLIDAGIPFTLSTVYPGGAHCQVVSGYDEFRQVLLICDPDHRSKNEFLADEGLKSMASCGPRGMAMVPPDRADALAAMSLPEAELHDALHHINLALVRHDRTAAAACHAGLAVRAPDHRLTWQGKWALAAYDGDPSAGLEAVEALCRLFPDNVNWQMERISRMAGVRSTDDRLAALRTLCEAKDCDPLLWRMLARELHGDARHIPEARRWLTKVLRHRQDAMGWLTCANLLWDGEKRMEATELYRLASCCDSMNENLALSYFRAARWTKQTETALAYLRTRALRMGRTSGQPARTLHDALIDLDRWEEALDTLEESLRTRPDDADQMLFAARIFANLGKTERAGGLLEAAKEKGRPSEWRRVSAEMLRRQCRPEEALAEWDLVVADEPLAMDAHRAIAMLHERLHGAQAALRYSRTRCEQWPHYWPLHEMLLDWARNDGPGAWEDACRKLIGIQPHNAWAHRELALALEAQKKIEEAHSHLDAAAATDPHSASLHYIRGLLHRSVNRVADAVASFRHALEIDVDQTHSIDSLLQSAGSAEQRLELLKFVQAEITRQTTNGESVSRFADCARPYLAPPSLQEFLEEAHRERPDLWQTWTTLAAHLRDHDKADQAVSILEGAVRRFPLMPRIWLELAAAHAAKPDRARQIEALEKSRELNPAWGLGMRTLAEALDLVGRFDESRAIMEQATRSSPLDAWNRGWLAERLWTAGQRQDALRHVTEAVRLEPGYGWAWERLSDWSSEMGQPELAREALNRLKTQRPMEPRTWMRVADSFTKREEFGEKVAALDKAIALSPHATPARDEKARVLALAGRFEEALGVCRQTIDGMPSPPEMGAREAWVLGLKGDLDGAISAMDAALARDGANVWGWERLAEWHQERNEFARAETAVQQIARLRPNDPVPHGFIADLRLKQSDREGAIRALSRSIEIAPGYRFGGFTLFQLHRDMQEYAEAERVLNSIRPHIGNLHSWARDFSLARRRSNKDAALSALRQMLDSPEDEPPAFDLVCEELARCHGYWLKAIRRVCTDSLRKPAGNPERGRFYVHVCQRMDRQPKQSELDLLPAGGIATQRAYRQWLSYLGDQGWKHDSEKNRLSLWIARWRVKRLIRRHESWLRQDMDLWGIAGYALHSMRMPRATAAWMADWRDRPEVQSWMLNNLALSLQQLGDRRESTAVIHYGLTLPEHSQTTMRFRLWAALDAALEEKETEARNLLDAVDVRRFEDYEVKLHEFVQFALRYQPGSQSPAKVSEADLAALGTVIQWGGRNKLLTEDIYRACRLISHRTRRRGMSFWAWRRLHPNLWAVIAFGAVLIALKALNQLSK